MQGPEDTKWWKKILGERPEKGALVCRRCGLAIMFWHCAESGCVWCAGCGTNSKEDTSKKGK